MATGGENLEMQGRQDLDERTRLLEPVNTRGKEDFTTSSPSSLENNTLAVNSSSKCLLSYTENLFRIMKCNDPTRLNSLTKSTRNPVKQTLINLYKAWYCITKENYEKAEKLLQGVEMLDLPQVYIKLTINIVKSLLFGVKKDMVRLDIVVNETQKLMVDCRVPGMHGQAGWVFLHSALASRDREPYVNMAFKHFKTDASSWMAQQGEHLAKVCFGQSTKKQNSDLMDSKFGRFYRCLACRELIYTAPDAASINEAFPGEPLLHQPLTMLQDTYDDDDIPELLPRDTAMRKKFARRFRNFSDVNKLYHAKDLAIHCRESKARAVLYSCEFLKNSSMELRKSIDTDFETIAPVLMLYYDVESLLQLLGGDRGGMRESRRRCDAMMDRGMHPGMASGAAWVYFHCALPETPERDPCLTRALQLFRQEEGGGGGAEFSTARLLAARFGARVVNECIRCLDVVVTASKPPPPLSPPPPPLPESPPPSLGDETNPLAAVIEFYRHLAQHPVPTIDITPWIQHLRRQQSP